MFLLTAATWNYEKVKPVVDYILNDIIVLYDITQPTQYNIQYVIENNDFDEYKQFCLNFLNNADISISDFKINIKKVKDLGKQAAFVNNLIHFFTNNNEEQIKKFENSNTFNIQTIHQCNSNCYSLELAEESNGTQQLFYLAPALF